MKIGDDLEEPTAQPIWLGLSCLSLVVCDNMKEHQTREPPRRKERTSKKNVAKGGGNVEVKIETVMVTGTVMVICTYVGVYVCICFVK